MLKCLQYRYSSSILTIFFTFFLLSFFFLSTPPTSSFSQYLKRPRSSLPVARAPYFGSSRASPWRPRALPDNPRAHCSGRVPWRFHMVVPHSCHGGRRAPCLDGRRGAEPMPFLTLGGGNLTSILNGAGRRGLEPGETTIFGSSQPKTL